MSERNYGYERHSRRRTQSFSPFVDEYFLNKHKKLELKPIQRNQQEYIDSQEYVKLDEIYDTMSSYGYYNNQINEVVDGLIQERENAYSELDLLMQVDELYDNYKNEMGLDKALTRSEIYGLIKSRADKAVETINLYKEGKINAEEIQAQQKSQQKELHKDSTQGTPQESA